MAKILQTDDKRLRQKTREVPRAAFGTKDLKDQIKEMSKTLAVCDDGVALAAPQIGLPWRIFIISGKVFTTEGEKTKPDAIFINPVLKKLSSRKAKMEEGCLSVRWLYGTVKRAEKASLEAYDEEGHKFSRSGSGLIAQIFQHEMDHLDGILFIDKATNLEEIPPEEIQKQKSKVKV